MKKLVLCSWLPLALSLFGCSNISRKEEKVRDVASNLYQCKFEESINGQNAQFIFTPENLELSVESANSEMKMIKLREDNFITGGFSYIQEGDSHQDIKVEKIQFTSFTSSPRVSVDLKVKNEPNKVIEKFCL